MIQNPIILVSGASQETCTVTRIAAASGKYSESYALFFQADGTYYSGNDIGQFKVNAPCIIVIDAYFPYISVSGNAEIQSLNGDQQFILVRGDCSFSAKHAG